MSFSVWKSKIRAFAAVHHRGDLLRDANEQTLLPLLIFDQFEEIFTLAQVDDVERRFEHVPAVEQDGTFGARAGNRVVHAIEAAQERRFAAAAGADQGRDLPLGNVETDVA